jgi:RecB family exonuclease
MNIEHVSVSRSKSYKNCAKYYKFKYHDKLPNPGEEQFYFVYGKIVHKIAETYVECRGERTLGEIRDDVLRGKILLEENKPAPPLPAAYARRLPDHLRSIQKLTDRIGTGGILEYKFRYDLDPPHEKFVTGFIDRLIKDDKQAFILDYKTTKKGPYRETATSIKHDLQLRCYARVVQREFGIPAQNIKCALYYLEGGDLIPAVYTEQALLNAEKELLAVYNQIQQHDPDKVVGTVGPHCQRCEYKDLCPFFRAKGGKTESWDGTMSDAGW